MKSMAAVLTGSCLSLSSAAAMAATAQDDNRASMLSILLVAAVMIVAVKLVIAFAKKKMDEDLQAAKEKSGAKAQDNDSQVID
jgi:mannitol-specific phosphotransferase system IIBC component